MIDARISVGLPSHPKTKKLVRRLGGDGAWKLVCLFLWAAANRPDGDLSGMSWEDVELSVDWSGEEGTFVAALRAVGFLDGDEGSYRIHDWAEHNPWAAGAEARAEKSRWLALCKHHGRQKAAEMMPEYAARLQDCASSTATASEQDASSRQEARNSSAPSPLPSPLPSPSPIVEGLPQAASTHSIEGAYTADDAAAASPPDPIHLRAIELTVLLHKRGAKLQAHDPTVRGWAERGITDAQALTAFDIALERRAQQSSAQAINAGYLDTILRDVTTAPPGGGARASPARRGLSRDEGRTIAATTRLSDFRAACAAEQGATDERTIEAPTPPRRLG